MKLKLPKVINWMYSGQCNLGCKFCYGRFNPDSLSLKQKYWIVDKIASSNIPKLTITGGEPLLGEGVYEIIAYAKSRNIFISLHTNGILLNEEGIDKLVGNVGRVSLPLEGASNEVNYLMRGRRGYFDLILTLMKKLKKKSIPISIKTVASRKNILDIPNLIPILSKFNPDVWLISEFVPLNRGKQYKKEFELKAGDLEKLKNLCRHAPFKVVIRSRGECNIYPFFFIDSTGRVYAYSPDGSGDQYIGSFLKEETHVLWDKIIKITPVNNYYLSNTWTGEPSPVPSFITIHNISRRKVKSW